MSSVWPSWRYRRNTETGETDGRIFQNLSELINAGEGWCLSPADVDAQKAKEAAPVPVSVFGEQGSAEAISAATEAPDAANTPDEIDFTGLDMDALCDIAEKAGIKVDRRWGRTTLEAKLREAA